MRKTVTVTRLVFVLVVTAILGVEASALAQVVSCDDGSAFPDPVYIAGSSALKAAFDVRNMDSVSGLGRVLINKNVGLSIMYQPEDSCFALNDLLLGHAATQLPVTDPPTLAAALYPFFYVAVPPPNPSGLAMATQCTPAVPPPPIDIAVSDVFYDTCVANGPIPSLGSQREILGPIQAMTFAAPLLSNASAISAEAAYVVFGYDANNYVVEPWDQSTSIFVRPGTSGVDAMIGAAIGLSGSRWPNTQAPTCMAGEDLTDGCVPVAQKGTSIIMADALANMANDQTQAIGVLSGREVTQYNSAPTSNKLKIIAYQHAGQACGYLPDSTASSQDKLNVRQGRYAIWGPLHFFFNVDGNGNPLPGDRNPAETGKIAAMTAILNYFVATGPNPNQTFPIEGPLDGLPVDGEAGPGVFPPPVADDDKLALVQAEAKGSLVPWCAMQVIRTSEIGAEASYQPREPCSCFYANAVGATMPDYCDACLTSADCAAPYPTCRLGYCEIQ